MKRKIVYKVTIGSKWPKDLPNYKPSLIEFDTPVGGVHTDIELEFETDSQATSMHDADVALGEYIKAKYNETYHIHYWTWLR